MKKYGINTLFTTLLITLIIFPVNCNGSPPAPKNLIFYIDSESDSDTQDGRSPETAWKSLEKVNSYNFKHGSKILFKKGTTYKGRLYPRGSGKEGQPIVIDNYGKGTEMPGIDAMGKYNEAILLKNQQYWEINNLEILNSGSRPKQYRYGVHISAANCGAMKHIHMNGLYIHDINGTLQKKDRAEGHGIFYENTGLVPAYFDDLVIRDCRIEHVDRNGIGGYTAFRTYSNIKNLNVVFLNNRLIDIGGDGIKVHGCDRALIEKNLVQKASQRHKGFSCGIWPFSTINSVFQYNEVCYMKSTRDGQAFDSDNDCRNNIFQYNYSHDNEGGFFLICTRYLSQNNIGNDHTVIRYNISQNDHNRTFLFGGPVTNLLIYNNVIFIDEELDVKLFHFAPRLDPRNREILWGKNINCFNNIVISRGKARLTYNRDQMNEDGTYNGLTGPGRGDINFESNIFSGFFNYPFWIEDASNVTSDPCLVDQGSGD